MDLKRIESVEELHDIESLNRELKRIQSVKCRLKKQKGRSDYQSIMTEVLQYEEVLKEARQLLNPREKNVTNFTQEDVNILDYDSTIKAIRSIQSKKTLTRWITTEEGNNDEFRSACEIEKMLISHRNSIKPIEDGFVRKSDIVTIVTTIEESGKITTKKVVELLKSLL